MGDRKQWDELISFWFDRPANDWFVPPPGFDDEIRSRFGALIKEARADKLDHWAKDPTGAVCLLLLLDQFPRNVFRGSGESFSSDGKALQIAIQGVAQQFDTQVGRTSKFQQTLFYLPFMHAEDMLAQVASKALYQNLIKECEKDTDSYKHVASGLKNARCHLTCIAQYARFPKRNEAIGRETTKEESEFLKKNPTGLPPDTGDSVAESK